MDLNDNSLVPFGQILHVKHQHLALPYCSSLLLSSSSGVQIMANCWYQRDHLQTDIFVIMRQMGFI